MGLSAFCPADQKGVGQAGSYTTHTEPHGRHERTSERKLNSLLTETWK